MTQVICAYKEIKEIPWGINIECINKMEYKKTYGQPTKPLKIYQCLKISILNVVGVNYYRMVKS